MRIEVETTYCQRLTNGTFAVPEVDRQGDLAGWNPSE